MFRSTEYMISGLLATNCVLGLPDAIIDRRSFVIRLFISLVWTRDLAKSYVVLGGCDKLHTRRMRHAIAAHREARSGGKSCRRIGRGRLAHVRARDLRGRRSCAAAPDRERPHLAERAASFSRGP